MANSAARAEYILQELLLSGEVAVDALATQLTVDSSTIRRDLERLERQRLLRRVHGGAVREETLSYTAYAYDLTFQENLGRCVAEKMRIAQAAARLIQPGDTIALSPGTTVTMLARLIRQLQIQPLAVVTNAANIAMELAGAPGVSLVLTGGMLLPDFFALVGPMAEQNLAELYTARAFMGVHGVSALHGLTGPNQLEALTHRATMQRARETILLADHSKIGQVGLFRIAAADTAQRLITDDAAAVDELHALEAQGVAVTVVPQ